MVIVAHQDDDGLMLTPDLQASVASNKPLQTVYMTSGDAGFDCNDYTQARERGAKAAHAMQAGVPNRWVDEERIVRGKRLRFSRLVNTQQTMVFFGLTNRVVVPTDPAVGALQQLWTGTVPTIRTLTLDGRSGVDTYTKEELLERLRELMNQFQPDDVRTMDGSELQALRYPFEHSDHVYSALFTMAAMQRRAALNAFTMYRSYSIVWDPPNLSSQATEQRRRFFNAYRPYDAKICDTVFTQICGVTTTCDPYTVLYEPFFPRSYPIETLLRDRTLLHAGTGACLEANGAAVRFASCNASASAQQWTLSRGGEIKNRGNGRCLRANAVTAGSGLALSTCARERSQQFFVTSQGQLRGPEATCVSSFMQPTLAACAAEPFRLGWTVD